LLRSKLLVDATRRSRGHGSMNRIARASSLSLAAAILAACAAQKGDDQNAVVNPTGPFEASHVARDPALDEEVVVTGTQSSSASRAEERRVEGPEFTRPLIQQAAPASSVLRT